MNQAENRLPETLPALRDVIKAHGLDAKKALGQHFLLDPSIVARIAALGAIFVGGMSWKSALVPAV